MNVVARRVLPTIVATLVTLSPLSAASATPPPYPATLMMQHGMLFSNSVTNEPEWGTKLTAAEARWVTIKSAVGTDRWGVWRLDGVSETFPVRSVNGGATWTEAGPMLATDWAGGSLFYVSKVYSEGPHAVVMVSNSVIDVSTDGGRQWYQYLNSADIWDIASYPESGAIELRISGASYSQLPKGSYAVYVLNVADHQWRRIRQSTV
jgi:hypothetical protein